MWIKADAARRAYCSDAEGSEAACAAPPNQRPPLLSPGGGLAYEARSGICAGSWGARLSSFSPIGGPTQYSVDPGEAE